MHRMIMLGFDFYYFSTQGLKMPLRASLDSHVIVVGGSGSGKSTAILYWLYKISICPCPCELYIADFKASHEFTGISSHFAEFEACYDLIKSYYEMFLSIPEGGNGRRNILLIDEIAGLLSYYSVTKEGKQKAEEIKSMISTILMLGRSRKCFVWLSMQRYSASIFPSASGSADNFHVCVGLGRLTVDGRKGLFAGEHFDGEEDLQFKQGTGIVLIDGQPLRSLIIPDVSKAKVLKLLQSKWMNK